MLCDLKVTYESARALLGEKFRLYNKITKKTAIVFMQFNTCSDFWWFKIFLEIIFLHYIFLLATEAFLFFMIKL